MANRGVANKREAIMEAALKLFASGHYHTTTIPDIAMLASVGEGTIYYYFRCKADLAAAIYAENTRTCEEQIKAALAAGATPRESLDNAAHYLLRKAELQPDLVRFILLASRGDYLPQSIIAGHRTILDTLAPVMREARCRGEVKEMDVELLSQVWSSVIQGAIQERCQGHLRRSLVSLAEPLCQCAWDAIRR